MGRTTRTRKLAGGAGGIHRAIKFQEFQGEDLDEVPHHLSIGQASASHELLKWAGQWGIDLSALAGLEVGSDQWTAAIENESLRQQRDIEWGDPGPFEE